MPTRQELLAAIREKKAEIARLKAEVKPLCDELDRMTMREQVALKLGLDRLSDEQRAALFQSISPDGVSTGG